MNEELFHIINNFDALGEDCFLGKRNTIKIFEYQGEIINIKSFKIPSGIQSFIYKYIRKSKARRSFENASILLAKGIGTPRPIAYHENSSWFGLKDSYYICEHLNPDFLYTSLFRDSPGLDRDKLIRGMAKFSFQLHEKGIEFLDHSQGNSLVKVDEKGEYHFFLVDLNRMKFHQDMPFQTRMQNMRKLGPEQEIADMIANEYAKYYKLKSEKEIATALWEETTKFYAFFKRKQALKKKLKLK
jgi:hypothetical protein